MMSLLHGFVAIAMLFAALRYLHWLAGLSSSVLPQPKTGGAPMEGLLSVLVPVHNEVHHLERLMDGLARQKAPGNTLLEFWIVDDHSTDGSDEVIRLRAVQDRRFRYLRSAGRGKKIALASGLAHCRGQWVATTDADVDLPSQWLDTLFAPPLGAEVVRIGPVWPRSNRRFPQNFFALEHFSMVLAGMRAAGQGRPGLSSGTNLAVLRSFRSALPHDALKPELASGDDVFLVEAARRLEGAQAVRFMPEAGVFTEVPQRWSEWFEQRVRWGSKARHYAPGPLRRLAWTVWMGSFACVALPALVGAWGWAYWGIKAVLEAWVLIRGAQLLHPEPMETRSWRVVLPFAVVFQPMAVVVLGLWGLKNPKPFSENRSRSGFGRAADRSAEPPQSGGQRDRP